jgi:PAS domain S-box-containing protein
MTDRKHGSNRRSRLGQHGQQWGAAYLVLAIGLVVSLAAFSSTRSYVQARDHHRFAEMAERATEAFKLHTEFYLNYLKALCGLFAAHTEVTQEHLERFLDASGIRADHDMLAGVGYALRVPAAEAAEHMANMRRHRLPLYSIIGKSLDPSASYPILYFDNFKTNRAITLGWNPASEAARWAAMEQARDMGQPVTTGKVELHHHPPTNSAMGFIIYLPVYQPDAPLATVEERRAALRAFVFGSFVPSQLWAKVVQESDQSSLALQIYDGDQPAPRRLLFDSTAGRDSAAGVPAPRFSGPVVLGGLGRTWRLDFSTRPGFEQDSRLMAPWLTLGGGFLVSLLLFGITAMQVRARAGAERLSRELQTSEADLLAEKERLAVTLRSISDGVITTDTAGRVVLVNQAAEELTGWSKTDAVGQPLATAFRCAHVKTRETLANVAERVLTTGRGADQDEEVMLVAKDGAERLVAASAAPMVDQQGRVIGVVLVFRDITERQRMEAEMLRSSKLESLGVLAGGIAHDFNNILMAIIGNLSVAKLACQAGTEVSEALEHAEEAALRAKDLTGQLLTFAKGGSPVKRTAALGEIIKDSVELILHGANVRCELELPADLCAVEVDPAQMGQVFHNLVINAMQAMPEGGVVRIRARNVELGTNPRAPLPAGPGVEVAVTDQGLGIRPEHLSRIFDPYFTTKQRGSGLGLTTAYSIVQKHGGLLSAESTFGVGSTFRLYLPAISGPVPPVPPTPADRPAGGQGRILVMDDEAAVRTVVRAMLTRLGYEVELTEDGTSAIDCYLAARERGRPFAALIMDLTIPGGLGGREALARLRAVDSGVRAVVSSGYSTDPVMAHFKDYGFCAVIEKPYRVEQLAKVLREVLDGSKV